MAATLSRQTGDFRGISFAFLHVGLRKFGKVGLGRAGDARGRASEGMLGFVDLVKSEQTLCFLTRCRPKFPRRNCYSSRSDS